MAQNFSLGREEQSGGKLWQQRFIQKQEMVAPHR
jgi:hypothetical protein